jgi:ATP-dependent DNA ligase
LKHDGFRAIAYIEANECRLVSRNSNAFASFATLRKSLATPPVKNAILDGEVVCLDANGVSQFNELKSRKGKPVFYAFDLMWLDGEDLRNLSLIERKQRLCKLRPAQQVRPHHLRSACGDARRRILRRDLQSRLGRYRCQAKDGRVQKQWRWLVEN